MKGKTKTLFLYLLVLILIVTGQAFGLLRNAENRVEDALYQTGTGISNDIYVIGIDEETLSRYGAFDVWGREKIADLITVLTEDPAYAPAVIAVDVGFYGTKDPAIDDKLVQAVKKAGNVILTETATFGNVPGKGTQVVLYEEPFSALKQAALSAGHANIQLDDDGVARHGSGDLLRDGTPVASFDTEIYKAYLASRNQSYGTDSPGYFGSNRNGFYIRYAGMPRAYYGSVGAGYSLYKVVEGKIPARAFKDAVVFIGAYASGMQDNYYSSISKETQMFGVEIHANIVNQLMDGDDIREPALWVSLLPTLLLGILTLVIVSLLSAKLSLPVSLFLAVGYFFTCQLTFHQFRTILPVLYPLAVVILMAVTYVGVRYFLVSREKKRIIANYGKYLSPDVAKTIADIGEESLSLGGIKKDIAVLFVDIRGFTTLSESLAPERVFEMLNSYLKVTTTAIFQNQGTVDKFIGDATMGVFNAPLDLEDYTYKCVCAGLDMAELGKDLDASLPEDLRGRVGFGVGIHCGDAVVGNVGTDFRMEYTAIGDTVNTASRLEGQAKAGCVILSEAVYERVKDRILCEDAGQVKLKGKANEVQIYRAIARK